MTIIDSRAIGVPVRPDLPALLLAGLRRVGAILRERRRRRTARQAFLNLLNLEDRMLADIGLTRAEVERAARLPLRIDAATAVQDWRMQARRRG